jgi:hypothetical protein
MEILNRLGLATFVFKFPRIFASYLPHMPRSNRRYVETVSADSSECSSTEEAKTKLELLKEGHAHQALISVALQADMPLPESIFYDVFGHRRVFDEAYQQKIVRPMYVGKTRMIRLSDVKRIIEARTRESAVNPPTRSTPRAA